MYYLLIILPIVQNLSLGSKFGKIARSPIPFLVPLFIIFIFFNGTKFKLYKENKLLIKLLVYFLFISLAALMVYFFMPNSQVVILGENVFVKTVKGLLYYVIVVLYVWVLNTIIEEIEPERVFTPFIITTIILFILLLFEVSNPELFGVIFHNNPNYPRVRLLSSESSFTMSMVFIYPLISIYYYMYVKKSKLFTIIFITIFLIFLLTSGSKSILINIPIALIILLLGVFIRKILLKNEKGVNVIKVIFLIIGFGVVVALLGPKFMQLFRYMNRDIQEYTSIITRFYTLIIGIISMFKYPLGTGPALYLAILPKQMDEYLHLISDSGMNLTEIYSYIYAMDDSQIGIKSGMGQYALYWGVIGTAMFCFYLIRTYRQYVKSNIVGKYLLMFSYVVVIVGIIDFLTFDTNYEVFALIVLLQYMLKSSTYNPNVELKEEIT